MPIIHPNPIIHTHISTCLIDLAIQHWPYKYFFGALFRRRL